MTPGARVQAAIDVLCLWRQGSEGLDRVMTRWARGHRFAGAGDRHAIADIAYGALRRARSAQWLAGGGDPGAALGELMPRRAVIGALALAGETLPDLFTGLGHAPATLSPSEAGTLRDACGEAADDALAAASPGVRADLPDWLLPRLAHLPPATIAALGQRAPLDLRVNRLKATVAEAVVALAGEGIATEPGPLSPDCLRVVSGARRVGRSRAYAEGMVEIQDAASQAAARLAPARPGDTVLDFCAGGGGKTLALGALMAGRGRLLAHDAAPERMRDLPARAARAGIAVETVAPAGLVALEGTCDVVFADAPCSGSGAWRRNPDAKWRLTPARLEALLRSQDEVLEAAARAVCPGGCLVYATCSVLREENDERVAAFLDRHPGWRREGEALELFPGPEAGDGFFAIRLCRDGPASPRTISAERLSIET